MFINCNISGQDKGVVLVAVEDHIRQFNYGDRTYTHAVIGGGKIKNMAVDVTRRLVYWTDTIHKAIYR